MRGKLSMVVPQGRDRSTHCDNAVNYRNRESGIRWDTKQFTHQKALQSNYLQQVSAPVILF